MSEKVKFVTDLLKFCFLPELKKDFDETPLQSDHFAEYHKVLCLQLPILYDFVQKEEKWIFAGDDKDAQEAHALLTMVLCEISAPNTVYMCKSESLVRNANSLLGRCTQLQSEVEEIIFKHYQNKLHKDCWKRNLGAIHGFVRFLEFRYNDTARASYSMPTEWLNFCLAVALTVRECYDPTYKQCGNTIFHLMLNHARFDDIKMQNIHCVIYDAVFKDVHFMNSVAATVDIWNCLCRCLDFFDNIDSLTWSCVDDLMEVLLRDIPIASDSLISICMLKYVTKLGCYFTINRLEIEAKYNVDLNVPSLLEECRFACMGNSSYTPFRWAKNILTLFNVESYKLMQGKDLCRQLLQEMHRCYMVCITPIPLRVIQPHLLPFLEKFVAVLMEVIMVQNKDSEITKVIKCTLETFLLQIERHSDCTQLDEYMTFRNALQSLLENEIFVSLE